MKESAEGMTIEGKVGFVKGERIHLTGRASASFLSFLGITSLSLYLI